MGSSHELQNRRKRRNSDCISNYVDRVRICDTKSIDSESIYSKANSQKSGWRQKSLSNIDLSLSNKDFQPGAGAFRYRDFEAHDDLCIKNIKNSKNIEIQRDYEDICNVNPKAQGQKRDIIQEHNKLHITKKENEPSACTLRRSKSLAVIREETFNELAITGAKTRRSQLIPRAKLIDRNFFKERLSFPLDEAFNISLDSTIDNESKKSNSNYYSWQCDRSDLGSIDSSIFKHSLHQSSYERASTLKTDSTKIVSRAEIHNDADDVVKSSHINDDTESGITIIEIKDRKSSSGPTSSVISYDSIYLSSESDRQTVLGEAIENIDAKIQDFEDIIKELNNSNNNNSNNGGGGDGGKTESIIDNLYSQVGKAKADVIAVEPKISADTLSKYTDYISKGTLERLTLFVERNGDNERKTISTGYQYSSLPDAGISKLLRDCELIDANLRDDVSVELLEPFPDYDSLPNEPHDEGKYASVFKPNGALDSKKSERINKSSTEPVSIEEKEKGAPSIELVQLPTKELIDKSQIHSSKETIKTKNNTTKVYLPEIGVEFDYENSIASFESDGDFESPSPEHNKPPIFNLVTISGRKVIVDELAAKVEHNSTSNNNNNHSNDFSGEKVVKEKINVNTSSIISSNGNGSSTTVTKKVVKNFDSNDEDKQKAHKEKKITIKVSESKQELVDCSDKTRNLKDSEENKKNHQPVQSVVASAKSYRLLRRNCLSFNMPRPQLLSIIDSKNSVPKKENIISVGSRKSDEVRAKHKNGEVLNQTEREFLHKVDSVRNYWSKLNDDDEEHGGGDETSNLKHMSKNFLSSKSSNDIPESLKDEDFQSFFPAVEIVELNGETQAALVTSRKLNDVEFDHVRYKVMKSDMFQKNLLVGNRKENQFDGLMQYLQDYSFQELLANNNVVIIEPVRTKIEKITEQPNKAQSASCKITNGALNRSNGSNNLKKHFFYHPIRVNKELYEEELPVPDTVRNVRKLFEGSLKRCVKPSNNETKLSPDLDNLRKKPIRYLTIDTSFDNNNLGAKWDSVSLSSGVSSAADLNSPCECQESSNKECSSKENLDEEDDDGEFKSHYVSDDVLEKIRECGSSITYYGGQSMDKKTTNSDTMTKAIMREISNQKCNCQSRRPRATNEKSMRKLSNDYSGLKFKLVKSNSCSSRLELTGIDFVASEQMRNMIHNERDSSPGNDDDDDEEEREKKEDVKDLNEESVKDMVNRLELKKAAVPSKPRIIESKCIEKVSSKDQMSPKVTINQQSFAKVLPTETVTVNNHKNSGSGHLQQQHQEADVTVKQQTTTKIVRNKNVDLALASVNARSELLKNPKASSGDTENLAPKGKFKEQHEIANDKQSKWSNICKMESVEMVKNQEKKNIKNYASNDPSSLKSSLSKSELSDDRHVKMVNWSTVGSSLGKEYITNDRNLIQTKIFDEMEFEEFEVMGEHYDSLNSK